MNINELFILNDLIEYNISFNYTFSEASIAKVWVID